MNQRKQTLKIHWTKLQGRMSVEMPSIRWKSIESASSKRCESRISKSSTSHCIRGYAWCRMVFGWRGRGIFTSPFRRRNGSRPRSPSPWRCNERRRMATINRYRWRSRRILVSRTMWKRGQRRIIGARTSAFRSFVEYSFVWEVVQGNTDL